MMVSTRVPAVWTLRRHLSVLLLLSMVLTLALSSGALLIWRLPGVERDMQQALRHDVQEMGARTELLLGTRREQLVLLVDLLRGVSAPRDQAVLDQAVHHIQAFSAIYRVSLQGRVLAVGLPADQRMRRPDVLGSDLSANSLFRAVSLRTGVAWSGRYLSPLTGLLTVGLAYRNAEGEILVAEVPVKTFLATVEVAAGGSASSIWIVDEGGEILADTEQGLDTGKLNIRNWPLMEALLRGSDGSRTYRLHDGDYRVATAHSLALGWYFVGHTPAGLANPQMRAPIMTLAVSFIGCVTMCLVMAPFWASFLARPLQAIGQRAARTMRGEADDRIWRQSPVAEFNRLSRHLAAMAEAMRERELKFRAIFNGSPVPMVVTDMLNGSRVLDANEAWCRTLLHRRKDVLGRTSVELGLFTEQERAALGERMRNGRVASEIHLRRRDGEPVMVQAFGQVLELGRERWLVWAWIDVGPLRRAELELRALNQLQEVRVQARARALARSNVELSQTVQQLRAAQDELVRAEKMAALGGLVAGVAHELNTPLGNGVMAVSAMADATQRFKVALQGGLKRADLQQLVQSLEQGADIAGRNLHRAAALVHSFKQVAVDQTSEQRRGFELGEVVHEMVVSLQPSFARQPWRFEVDVPDSGLPLDSYPGALGQVLGNLIQNAVVHGFEGRDHGTVRLTAGHGEPGWLWLRVGDDGHGIAAEHIASIFEPFVTTRKGRGGTGLGLHISYNAVVNVLGGRLTVQSRAGEGASFEVSLPAIAPTVRS